MKKFLVIMLAVVILATFAGCGKGTKEKTAEFQEKSYVHQDEYGNEYEVTIKISPWILKSKNPELINEVWAEVGQGNQLPETVEDWYLQYYEDASAYSGFTLIRADREGGGLPGFFSCWFSDFDMYYAMGSVKIKIVSIGDRRRMILQDVYCHSELFSEKEELESESYPWYGTFPMCCRVFYHGEYIYGVPYGTAAYRMDGTRYYRSINVSPCIEAHFIDGGNSPAEFSEDSEAGDFVEIPFIFMHSEATLPGKTKPYYRKQMIGKELTFFGCDHTGMGLVAEAAYSKESITVESYDSRISFVLDIID